LRNLLGFKKALFSFLYSMKEKIKNLKVIIVLSDK
jgi:hypothetical protein